VTGKGVAVAWRLLVVDDDPVYAQALARSLRRRGHVVEVSTDGASAVLAVKGAPYDAVILDLRLATESGLQFIAPMKSARPDLRILLLTGYASIATAVEAIKLGATHYLAKPAGVEEILAALGREGGDADVELPEAPLSVDRLEWEHIQKVLAEHEGNLSATARALKMHRRTLQRKLAKRPVKE
jgi:two-component system response regulator RegA